MASRVSGTDAARPPAPRAGRRLLLAAIVVCAVALAWRITARAVAHGLSQDDPARALAWAPADPEALARLSTAHLAGRGAAKDLAAAEAEARRTLALAPLSADALRNLALVDDARGRSARAAAVMARAGRRGFRDVATQAWLMKRSLALGDLDDTFLRLDALLRTDPALADRLFPAVAAISSAPIVEPLARRLAGRPPWREALLVYLDNKAPDSGPLALLAASLAGLRGPPNDGEAGALLSRMTDEGRYEEAHRLWASLLRIPAGARPASPYDGAFRGLEGAPPFNWRLFPAAGIVVETAKASTSRRTGLQVQYPVAEAATLADQLLVLAPGAYRLSARYRITGAAAGASLGWSVRCVVTGAVLLETRQRGDQPTPWTAASSSFAVPAGCPAQWLRLTGRAGDGFGDLSAAYDDLAITPA